MLVGFLYIEKSQPRSFMRILSKWGQRSPNKMSFLFYFPGFSLILYLCFGYYNAIEQGKDYYS
jgi:hypothetical protein